MTTRSRRVQCSLFAALTLASLVGASGFVAAAAGAAAVKRATAKAPHAEILERCFMTLI